MKLITSESLFKNLKHKTLLLDTSFFGDYAKYPVTFAEFVTQLRNNNTLVCTTKEVRIEYAKGTNNETHNKMEVKTRLNWIDTVIDKIIDSHSDNPEHVMGFYIDNINKITSFGKISYTDLALASIIHSQKNVLLMSKNFNDFPFEIKEHVTLYKNNKIESYAIYSI